MILTAGSPNESYADVEGWEAARTLVMHVAVSDEATSLGEALADLTDLRLQRPPRGR